LVQPDGSRGSDDDDLGDHRIFRKALLYRLCRKENSGVPNVRGLPIQPLADPSLGCSYDENSSAQALAGAQILLQALRVERLLEDSSLQAA
jgi:hypothetical protein